MTSPSSKNLEYSLVLVVFVTYSLPVLVTFACIMWIQSASWS